MARKPTGNPVGAPPKEIDWQLFEQLCGIQCTQSEMAGLLKVHHETLSIRVADHYGEDYPSVYKKLSEGGKCSLRRNQFVQSKTNASMAIFLGKNWLGQTDGREEKAPPNDKAIESELELIKQNARLLEKTQELQRQLDAILVKANSEHIPSYSAV